MTPELRRVVVRAYLKRLGLDDKPILVGPWRSEVGFEALYWIPFLKWALKDIRPARLAIVTRGGSGCLYPDHVADRDLYDLRSVADVRRENLYDWSRTKLQKQMRPTKWDQAVLADAAKSLGTSGSYHTLHPSWMYWALEPYWNEQRGLNYLMSMTDYTPLPKPTVPAPADEGVRLPEKYVAMRFYGRSTFPYPHPDTARFVGELVSIVAQQVPVVLLNQGHEGDEHMEVQIAGPNVIQLPKVPPDRNLALQFAVLGKATAFVGTYGGTAQTALRMGVPSVSFWTEFGGTCSGHLDVSNALARFTRTQFLTGSIADAGLWRQCLVFIPPVPQMALNQQPVAPEESAVPA